VGIVYISHKMDELKQISDRVTVMRDGQYIATVPTATTPIETIISMMVGRQLATTHETLPRHLVAPGRDGGARPAPRHHDQGRELLAAPR